MKKIQPIKLAGPRVADTISLPELTVRGLVLGALITVVFTVEHLSGPQDRPDLFLLDPGRGHRDGGVEASTRV
jgi:hypothetical protein